MHEGAVMQAVVTTILDSLEKIQEAHVIRVQLALGASEHVKEDTVRQYFQMLTQNTLIEGAELELAWLPATYRCLSCSRCFESISSTGICPHCGDIGLEVAHQDSCDIRRIDVVIPDA